MVMVERGGSGADRLGDRVNGELAAGHLLLENVADIRECGPGNTRNARNDTDRFARLGEGYGVGRGGQLEAAAADDKTVDSCHGGEILRRGHGGVFPEVALLDAQLNLGVGARTKPLLQIHRGAAEDVRSVVSLPR